MRRVLLTLLTAAVAAVSVPALATAESPRLVRGGDAEFPHQSFLLSLPAGSSAQTSDVQVFENGDPVHDLTVTSAGSAADGTLGTVLVIDASRSMSGAPIRAAMDAARAFAEHRRPFQQLGIVTFNRSTRSLLEPTTDDALIDGALATTPSLTPQTHVRDGVLQGIKMLEAARVQVGSVVVLSDGADTGSRASVNDLTNLAAKHGVRVFTVGLESKRFNGGMLARIARATGGDYLAAPSTDDLARVYDDLGARLAQEYLVRYSSVLGPEKQIRVEAVVDGVEGTGTVTYRSPKIGAAPLPQTEPEANGLWASGAAMVIVGFGAAFLLAFAAVAVVLHKRRGATPEERVAAFVAMGEAGPQAPEEAQREDLYDRVERGLSGRDWWRRFSVNVDVARIEREPAQIAVVTAVVTVLLMWLLSKIGAAWVALFALFVPWGVHKFVSFRAAKQRLLFGDQLADNLQVIASAMRAGQSFAGALAVAVEDAPEPAKREFGRVIADDQLGVPLEKSLGSVVDRMENKDLHQVALVAALQRDAGGNSAEVLDRVADTIRSRVALRRLVNTLTAQGRLSRWVVSFIPVGLVMFIGMANPDYLDPLFKTATGTVLLVVAGGMMIAGSLVMKKIADIKV